MISQEAESVESVTIEHPKSVTKLSKPKIITQQPNNLTKQ